MSIRVKDEFDAKLAQRIKLFNSILSLSNKPMSLLRVYIP